MTTSNSGSPASVCCADQPSQALLHGIDEFNRGMFFEQHETLEDAWIEESDPIRLLYQGILQIGVAFYHLKRGNYRGAMSLVERGMGYLRLFAPKCMSVDIGRLLSDAERARHALAVLGPDRMGSFDAALIPHIYLVEPEQPPASISQESKHD